MSRTATKQVIGAQIFIGVNDTAELSYKGKNLDDAETSLGDRTTVSLPKRESKHSLERRSERPGLELHKITRKNLSKLGVDKAIIHIDASLDSYESREKLEY